MYENEPDRRKRISYDAPFATTSVRPKYRIESELVEVNRMTSHERWLELKVQIDHEISESEGALLEGYQYNIRDNFPFGKVVQGTLRKVLQLMKSLEEK